MKLSKQTLLAGLIVVMVGVSGAAQATTVLAGIYNEISADVMPALDDSLGLGPASSVPEVPSWALMLLGLASLGLAGKHQAKKRREALTTF
jgi:hypothetical protein